MKGDIMESEFTLENATADKISQEIRNCISDDANCQNNDKWIPTPNFVMTVSADSDNILVDTCALSEIETLKIIEYAEQVTFIFSTLVEMDKKHKEFKDKKDLTEKELFFSRQIKFYAQEVHLKKEKFLLSSFVGMDGETNPDNILLQYIQILPRKLRPTLLTIDKYLADKAEALCLDYILYIPKLNAPNSIQYVQYSKSEQAAESIESTDQSTSESTQNIKQTDKSKLSDSSSNPMDFVAKGYPFVELLPDGSTTKKFKYGIQVSYSKKGIFLNYRGSSRLFINHGNGKTEEYPYNSSKGIRVFEGDQFRLQIKRKKKIIEEYYEKI